MPWCPRHHSGLVQNDFDETLISGFLAADVHEWALIWLFSRLSSQNPCDIQRRGMESMADETEDVDMSEDAEELENEGEDGLEEDELGVDDAEDTAAESSDEQDGDKDDEDESEDKPAKPGDDDDDEDEDDVEADLDTILKERLASSDDDDEEDEDEVVTVVTTSGGEEAAQKRSNEIVCQNCFFIIKESQLGPAGARTCPSGEDEADCAAIAHFGG